MKFSDALCLFSAEVEEADGSYYFELPKNEIELANIHPDGTYRVAVHPTPKEHSENDLDQFNTPIEEGEVRKVEIEDLGSQGDGITRVEKGYVVIVPNTEVGDHVTIKITEANPNVAFAEVLERHEPDIR